MIKTLFNKRTRAIPLALATCNATALDLQDFVTPDPNAHYS